MLCSYNESLEQRHVKQNKRLTIFISSQFKTGNMNHVMNLQFLLFAFNHILETSDYYYTCEVVWRRGMKSFKWNEWGWNDFGKFL